MQICLSSYTYNYSGAIAARGRLPSDDTPRPVIIRAVNCTGDETTLYGCSLTFASAQSCAVDQGVTCQGQTLLQCLVLYCTEQAPMGACSSSTKNWGWVVTRRRCLNSPTIPVQVCILDAKLAARVYRIDLHHSFAHASFFFLANEAKPAIEKAVSC